MTNSDIITTNKRGDVFVAFHRCEESRIPDAWTPITHALIVATHEGKTLLLLNTWKKTWELPGGVREPNESPRQCALRELSEETNQVVSDVTFRGIMEFRLQPDGRTEFGALFCGIITDPRPFISDGEAQRILFWNGSSDIGEIDLIDKKLVKYGG